MRTYLWSKIIEYAYNPKTMKYMYLDYMHNISEDVFLDKYLSLQNYRFDNNAFTNFKMNESRLGFKIMTIYDGKYPAKLKWSINPPIAFYYRGDIKLIEKKSIAVVGSRTSPDRYLKIAKNLGLGFNKLQLTGVSGLAKGIDGNFHDGCNNSIGILGCGIDVIYPYCNKTLFHKVLQDGCLISEYPLGSKPLPWHFPRRNRIIAALCDLLVIIYAKEKSGSLITLDYALDLGRDIFITSEMFNRLDIPGYSIRDLKKHINMF
ncbi:MAG: DNA-protecting protein DprA [Firmicutes bacterium]|nr:DNA-protecting protein DprA [Bacillota bacterium]